MPKRPPRACVKCGAPSESGRCPLHPYRDTRPNATRRGYGVQWHQTRAAVLKRDPVCVSCMVERSTDVDHIIAKARGGQDTMSNLRGMCHRCHSSRTAREDGGFGNRILAPSTTT